jgi:hypothetical protein
MDPRDVPLRVFASGVMELWAGDVRPGDRQGALGDEALTLERPLHLATEGAGHTVCGEPVEFMREYPAEFEAQESKIRCPVCDAWLGTRASG